MIDQIISAVAAWIVAVISATGYFGVVILMAIELACIPLPSEVIMPFAGYLVSTGQFSLIGAATAGALGCNIGSTIAYYVAAYGGRPVLERWGEYVLISPAELKRADDVFSALRLGHGVFRPAAAGGADFHRLSGGPRAHADAEIPGLHIPRLLAVVFRARLHRLCAGRALEQRPDAAASCSTTSMPSSRPCWWPALPGSSGRAGASAADLERPA